MFIRFDFIDKKELIGIRRSMSLVNDNTYSLFHQFMKLLISIGKKDCLKYDVRMFPEAYSGNAESTFIKWAAIDPENDMKFPDEFEKLPLIEGKYAVFLHQGSAVEAFRTFQYIFNCWFPESGTEPDQRLHFDVLPPEYKYDDPKGQHEIWIPVRDKRPSIIP